MTNYSDLHLDLELCQTRQKRLARILQEQNIDRIILARPEHIQYFTAFRPHRLMHSVISMDAEGTTTLIAPNQIPDHHAASQVHTFEAQWLCTLRQDQSQSALKILFDVLPLRKTQSLAVEGSVSGIHLLSEYLDSKASVVIDIEPELWKLRRKKDVDELAMIQQAIECTEAMYMKAREIIEPGITELEVYNQLHAAAVEVAGEPLTALGNDFQCNSPGGPPRARKAQTGELFILDLGPAFRGYFADNCRTFSVDQKATDEQFKAWEAITGVLTMVENSVRPRSSAKSLYLQAQAILDDFMPGAFFHHLGHGIGLFPHEGPHLNSSWDDEFQEGDVFTAEPGLYAETLYAGIRLEQNYLVTKEGVKRLTRFPLEL